MSKKNKKELPDHIPFLNQTASDYTDEQLEKLVSKISSIGVLKLDENDITNEGVQHLTKLKSIKELQLKDTRIDDDAIPYLQQLTDLEVLHLGSTRVTIDGILRLTSLPKLKKLLFSLDDTHAEKDKLDKFIKEAPECEIIINHKIYYRPKGNAPSWMI